MKPLSRVLTIPALAISLGTMVADAQVRPSLTLFNSEGLEGAPVVLRGDVANLQDVAAAEGFDGTANDYALSLRAEGLWLVCMDAGYASRCREVTGEVPSLGDDGGSISSARYLGPVDQQRPAMQPSEPRQSAPAAGTDEPPMYNTDLFGSDLREIIYDRPGMDWRSCKASCEGDRQCKAWTYVKPGRTEHGECFLKESVPEPSESGCCVSGIKRSSSRTGHFVPPTLPASAVRQSLSANRR